MQGEEIQCLKIFKLMENSYVTNMQCDACSEKSTCPIVEVRKCNKQTNALISMVYPCSCHE